MKRLTPKQQAKYAEKKILEENEDFYNEIVSAHYSMEKKRTKYIVGWAGSAGFVILTVVLCLVFLLPNNSMPPDSQKHYLLENEVSVASDLEELNSILEGFSLSIALGYEYLVRRYYDAEFNDNLYFILSIEGENTFETISIYVYINPLYDRQKQLVEERIRVTKIGIFQVHYEENTSVDQDDIYTFNYAAKTEYEDITVYIEYEQLWFEDDTNFFNFFEETFIMDEN